MNIYTELFDSRIKKVKDGEIIIQEDTWPYYAYILKEGKAKVLKNVDGKQVLIGLLTETKIINMKTFETEIEIEKIPEFMRRVVITMESRHSAVVEGLNILSSQLEKKQTRLMLDGV